MNPGDLTLTRHELEQKDNSMTPVGDGWKVKCLLFHFDV